MAVASSGKAAAAAATAAAAAAVDDDNRDEVRESLVTEIENPVHAHEAAAIFQHKQPIRVDVVSTGTFGVLQADIRKNVMKGFYWAFAMEYLYWAFRSGNAKTAAVSEYAADDRLERKLMHA